MSYVDYNETLTKISIDHLCFQVTWNPFEPGSCILWYMDQLSDLSYTALGKFSCYDKRQVLEFVVKYSTSSRLRDELAKRQFERKLDTLNVSYFEQIGRLTGPEKEKAFRDLFNLDDAVEKQQLSARRRVMVKKFHPDVGGDHRAMSVINEAYDFLASQAR